MLELKYCCAAAICVFENTVFTLHFSYLQSIGLVIRNATHATLVSVNLDPESSGTSWSIDRGVESKGNHKLLLILGRSMLLTLTALNRSATLNGSKPRSYNIPKLTYVGTSRSAWVSRAPEVRTIIRLILILAVEVAGSLLLVIRVYH